MQQPSLGCHLNKIQSYFKFDELFINKIVKTLLFLLVRISSSNQDDSHFHVSFHMMIVQTFTAELK